jgi:hypothetical protein
MNKFNATMCRTASLVGAVFLLGACGDNLPQTGPGGLTPDDAAALDVAAEKLDGQTLPPATIPAPSAAPAQEPVRNGAPSKNK